MPSDSRLRTPSRGRGSNASTVRLVLILCGIAFCGYIGFLTLSEPTTGPRGASLHHAASRLLHSNAQGTALQPLDCPRCPTCPPAQPKTEVITAAHYLHNPRRYHTITTTAGFSNHWQVRIHYYWFKRQKEACEAQVVCDMGGFTRLLHTGAADDLMDEVPTIVVDPLPKSAFGGKDDGYIVLNRPYAFNEWLRKASIPERYILMCESDHILMRPLPNIMPGEALAAALFTYINPNQYPAIIRSLVGNVSDADVAGVPRIGNSPTFVSVKDFRRLAPAWYNATMDIWKDETAHKTWNWVLEMYGFAVATFRTGLHKGLLHSENLLAHPPFDTKEIMPSGKPYYLLHLTYPMRYNAAGKMTEDEKQAVWIFDKRRYGAQAPPRNLPTPPHNVDNELARLTVEMVNEATENIPCWDLYVEKRIVTTECSITPAGALSGSQATANQAR